MHWKLFWVWYKINFFWKGAILVIQEERRQKIKHLFLYTLMRIRSFEHCWVISNTSRGKNIEISFVSHTSLDFRWYFQSRYIYKFQKDSNSDVRADRFSLGLEYSWTCTLIPLTRTLVKDLNIYWLLSFLQSNEWINLIN